MAQMMRIKDEIKERLDSIESLKGLKDNDKVNYIILDWIRKTNERNQELLKNKDKSAHNQFMTDDLTHELIAMRRFKELAGTQ